jgi:DNA-binding MurR/RpiR family transcriptional regulator
MSTLLKIRAERDSMSAIERRIADFVLDNAQLLRDYSSQQMANALGISQSSVVKFSQKLGFRGYPDLKYAIGQALARGDGAANEQAVPAIDDHGRLADSLWKLKSEAEEESRLINAPQKIDEIASLLGRAGKVFLIGLGEDDIHARAFALRLSMLGILTVHNFDTTHMTASVSSAGLGAVLLVFSEHGRQASLCQITRYFQQQRGKVISVTRHTSNPLRALADIALLVSAHDERPYIEPLLYHAGLQHLLDRVFVLLCEGRGNRLLQLQGNLERILPMLEP